MLKANEFFSAACYHNKNTREWIATTMLYKSIQLFYSTNIISNCDELYKIFTIEKNIVKLHTKSARILKNIKYPLLDNIAITTSYENFFKSLLLLKGYIIHQVVKKKDKALFKEQSKQPILISRLKSLENVLGKKKNDYSFDLIDYRTISLNQIITKPLYIKKLKIPSDVLSVLKRINGFRNSLHFIVGENSVWNSNILHDYLQLLNFANTKILKTYNRLAKRSTIFNICEYNEQNNELKFIKLNA